MKNNTTQVCSVCGDEFSGGFVKHAIKNHPRKNTTQAPGNLGVTGGDVELDLVWGAVGTLEQDLATAREYVRHVPAREVTSPVRARSARTTKAQVKGPKTPVVSKRTQRTDARNAVPAREQALRAELRQARRSMRRLQARLDASVNA